MRFFWDSYLKPAAVIIAVFVFAGLLALPEKKLLKSYNPDAVDMPSLKSTTGGGMLFGLLAGYRSLIAGNDWRAAIIIQQAAAIFCEDTFALSKLLFQSNSISWF